MSSGKAAVILVLKNRWKEWVTSNTFDTFFPRSHSAQFIACFFNIYFLEKSFLFSDFLWPPGETIWASLSHHRRFCSVRCHQKGKGICVIFNRNEGLCMQGTVILLQEGSYRKNTWHLIRASILCVIFSILVPISHQTRFCRTSPMMAWGSSQLHLLWLLLITEWFYLFFTSSQSPVSGIYSQLSVS